MRNSLSNEWVQARLTFKGGGGGLLQVIFGYIRVVDGAFGHNQGWQGFFAFGYYYEKPSHYAIDVILNSIEAERDEADESDESEKSELFISTEQFEKLLCRPANPDDPFADNLLKLTSIKPDFVRSDKIS